MDLASEDIYIVLSEPMMDAARVTVENFCSSDCDYCEDSIRLSFNCDPPKGIKKVHEYLSDDKSNRYFDTLEKLPPDDFICVYCLCSLYENNNKKN